MKLLNMSKSAEYLGIERRYLYLIIDRGLIARPMDVAGHPVYNTDYLDEVKPKIIANFGKRGQTYDNRAK